MTTPDSMTASNESSVAASDENPPTAPDTVAASDLVVAYPRAASDYGTTLNERDTMADAVAMPLIENFKKRGKSERLDLIRLIEGNEIFQKRAAVIRRSMHQERRH